MADIQDAIRSAMQFVEQVYSTRPDELRVEEVDSTEDSWFITLSFSMPAVSMSAIRGAIGTVLDRHYKIFKVSKSDGRVESMKIRQVG